MTTETRSLAEIIGWAKPDDGPPHKPGCEALDDPVHVWCLCSRGPTPDDMLLWLQRHCVHIYIGPDRDTPQDLMHATISFQIVTRSGAGVFVEAGPTLHAALEAAVRAAAGEAGE